MSIDHMLTQTCDLYAPVIGTEGIATYSATASAEDVKCRFESKQKQVTTSQGMTVTSDGMLVIISSATVTRDYKAVIDSTSYVIDHVETIRGLSAVSHYECYVREL